MAERRYRADMEAIGKLFTAKAVAIVGATPDLTKLGSSAIVAMHNLGYTGEIYAVNPRYTEIMGHPCVPTIADLPDTVEAAMLNIPAEAAIVAAEECGKKGIRSIVMVPQGFGEAGEAGKLLDRKVAALAEQYGLAIVGPNTNGLANPRSGLAMAIAPIYQFPKSVRPGSVSVVSQSGGMVSTLLRKMAPRGIGISKTVTCGNELLLTVADYLSFMAEDPETKVIVIFLETIRNAQALREALAKCRAAGKPVVAIKVGKSESGQKAAFTHTGAIAGSYRNTVAFLEREGVIVAEDIETLAALADLLERYEWPLKFPLKPCVISISGGFAAMAADEMAVFGLDLPDPSPEAAAKLAALPNQSHPVNPYDIAARNAVIPDAIDIFHGDGFNVIVFGLVLLKEDIRKPVQQLMIDARRRGVDHLILHSPAIPAEEYEQFFENGISVYDDTRPLWAALAKLRAYHGPSCEPAEPGSVAAVALPAGSGLLNEADSKAVIGQVGFPVPRSVVVRDEAGLSGLGALARPLAMKGLSDTIAHKTEHGLVALNLRTDDEIAAAYGRIRAALAKADAGASDVLVEEMAPGGLEAIIGVTRDPVVGPVVVVGAGGILVELLDDAVVIKPPFTAAELESAIAGTKLGKLLSGYRGRACDGAALIAAAVRIGDLAVAEPRIESLDINPVFVLEKGLVAVDAKLTLSD
ncbi:acetate--CoA ligase family protein [Alsobacter sp. SYSU M60028]|uniref:Acetate--CoA ligase family protein n=1 Tax=Alsobacter ponti TaxID=2962936 RepID=A0ABT1LEP5_9HYPH|nr:acetate--CoA ligase [Alsobacter ponti]MCP8939972.1 acetate--CoA ligase family protein [Alsobacter ponti]